MADKAFGPFELEEQIGRGGMGVVYRARYRKNDRIVALKVLSSRMTDNPRVVARFEREMQILERLKHPGVARYYGGGVVNGQQFIAMKLMSGGTLDDLLKKRGPLPWEQVVEFGKQICDALDHAHENGVIHRDLKPANLFVGRDRETGEEKLVLGDFGIAFDTSADGLTATGMTVGTFQYMAPEQITGKKSITARTDLYALGCVLFQMLTGRTPYEGTSQGEIMLQHLQEQPPPLRQLAPECPVWLETVVSRLLAKEPEDRPHDAAYVRMALDEVLDKMASHAGVTAHAASGRPSALTIEQLNPDLKKALQHGKQKKKRRKRDNSPFYERTWFLLLCLAGLACGVTWVLWPASEDELFAQAEPLMQSSQPSDHDDAIRKFLDPMLARFPEGRHASEAREFIRRFEVGRLMRRLTTFKNPKTEAERLFLDAWQFEEFGDRVSALEKYRAMETLLAGREGQETFVDLAKARIAEIESSAEKAVSRIELVNSELAEADRARREGNRLRAEAIWNSIISLYAGNEELQPQVDYARARLRGTPSEELEFSPQRKPVDGNSTAAPSEQKT
ncbi:protein kinase [bacterium]|nr:protein kinase [bacterium]